MSAPTSHGPVRPRTRGPVELVFETSVGLVFVALFAWFVGLMIELAGHYSIWEDEGAITHSARITQQDLGYIANAPRSIIVDNTQAFAEQLMGWAAWPYQRLGLLALHERMSRVEGPQTSDAAKAKLPADKFLKAGIGNATQAILKGIAYWAVVSMHVAQDVVLRLSVALFALPAFALACIVGVVDGLVRRDLRRWRGGRESSFVYHHAKHYTGWALTGGFGLYLTWPFGGFNPAYMVLVFTVLVAAVLSTTVAAFKKYV